MDYMKILHNTISQNVKKAKNENTKKEKEASAEQNQTNLNQAKADANQTDSFSFTTKSEENVEESVTNENIATVNNDVQNIIISNFLKNLKKFDTTSETTTSTSVAQDEAALDMVAEDFTLSESSSNSSVFFDVASTLVGNSGVEDIDVNDGNIFGSWGDKDIDISVGGEPTIITGSIGDKDIDISVGGEPTIITGSIGDDIDISVGGGDIVVIDDPIDDTQIYLPWKESTITLEDGSTITKRTYNDGSWSKISRDVNGNITGQEGAVLLKAGCSADYGNMLKFGSNNLPVNISVSNPTNSTAEITYSVNANGEVTINANNLDFKASVEYLNIICVEGADIDPSAGIMEMPLTNITFVGDNNTITGSDKNDNITVKGNNNKVDLGAGDDEATVKGNANKIDLGKGEDIATVQGKNNDISNVEDLLVSDITLEPGEKGTIEWINKLTGINTDISNAQYDDQGRLVSFDSYYKTIDFGNIPVSYTVEYSNWSTDINSSLNNMLGGITTTTKSFDSDGNCYYEREIAKNSDGNVVSSRYVSGGWEGTTDNTYNESGLLTSSVSQNFANGELVSTYTSNFEYDANGNTTRSEYADFDANGAQTSRYISEMTYFDNGNMATNICTDWGAEDNLLSQSIYENYENGNLRTSTSLSFTDNVQTSKTVNQYSEDGMFVSRTGEKTVKDGSSVKVQGVRLENNSGKTQSISFTYTADGHLELNADNMDISPSYKLYFLNDYADTNDVILANDDVNVSVKADENSEAELIDKGGYLMPYIPIAEPTLQNLTINGNNNNINGGEGNDNISVKGNNNVIDLAGGEDTLNIVGNNNRIKHVENVNTGMEPEPVLLYEPVEIDGKSFNVANWSNLDANTQSQVKQMLLLNNTGLMASGEGYFVNVMTEDLGNDNTRVTLTPDTTNNIMYASNAWVTKSVEAVFVEDGSMNNYSVNTGSINGNSTQTKNYSDGTLNWQNFKSFHDDGSLSVEEFTSYEQNGNPCYNKYSSYNKDGSYTVRIRDNYIDGNEQTDTITGYDKDGNVNYTVVDNFLGFDEPAVYGWSAESANIYFEDGSQMTVSTGKKAVISEDGTVTVSKADGSSGSIYNKDGSIICSFETKTFEDGSWSKVTTFADGSVAQEGMTVIDGRFGGNILPIDIDVFNPSEEPAQVSYSIDANGNVTISGNGLEFSAMPSIEVVGPDEPIILPVEPDLPVDPYEPVILDKATSNSMVSYKTFEFPLNNITFVGDNNKITGSSLDDNIVVMGNNNTVDLGDGNDKVYAEVGESGYTSITGGAGNDAIYVKSEGGFVNVSAGDGDDIVAVDTEGSAFIDAGEGNNSIQSASVGYTDVNTGDGDNDIAVSASDSIINTGAGNDTITLATGTWANVNSGAGDDDVLVSAGTSANVNAGDGNDKVYIQANTTSVDAGSGDDAVYAELNGSEVSGYFVGGDGEDTLDVAITNPDAIVNIDSDFETTNVNQAMQVYDIIVDAAAGEELFSIEVGETDSKTFAVNMPDGSVETFKLDMVAGSKVSISMDPNYGFIFDGEGYSITDLDNNNDFWTVKGNNITVDAAGGDDYIYAEVGGSGSMSIVGGTGNDAIYVKSEGGYVNVLAGDGDDKVAVDTEGSAYINAGEGNNSIQAASVGYTDVYTGNGDNEIAVSASDSYITTGAGNDTITLATGTWANVKSGAGDDNVFVSAGTDAIVNAGDGNDKVYVQANTTSVDAGSGDDTVYAELNGVNVDGKFVGGDGEDTLDVSITNPDAIVNIDADFETANINQAEKPAPKYDIIVDAAAGEELFSIEVGETDSKTFAVNMPDGSVETFKLDMVAGSKVSISMDPNYGFIFDGEGYSITDLDNNNDFWTVKGNNITVDAADGDDTIVAEVGAYGNMSIVGGAGNDAIYVQSQGGYVNVSAGDGDDYVAVKTEGNATISAGEGNNSIQAASVGYTDVFTGDGDNEIAVSASDSYIYTGAGNDTITLATGTWAQVDSGAGNDDVSVIAGTDATVNAGDGNDSIFVKSKGDTYIDAGEGDDEVGVTSEGAVSVVLGNGNDFVHADAKGTSYVNGNSNGDKDITLYAGGEASVITGNGNDNVYVDAKDTAYINTGAGNDRIMADISGKEINAKILGGDGEDNVEVYTHTPLDGKVTLDIDAENVNVQNVLKYDIVVDAMAGEELFSIETDEADSKAFAVVMPNGALETFKLDTTAGSKVSISMDPNYGFIFDGDGYSITDLDNNNDFWTVKGNNITVNTAGGDDTIVADLSAKGILGKLKSTTINGTFIGGDGEDTIIANTYSTEDSTINLDIDFENVTVSQNYYKKNIVAVDPTIMLGECNEDIDLNINDEDKI